MDTGKYLPIGTVVMLKGGTKRVMITGFCVMQESDKEKVWDYSACLYPEGMLSSTQNCLFNHDQIEKVYYLGLIDEEEEEFKKKLKELQPLFSENLQKEYGDENG